MQQDSPGECADSCVAHPDCTHFTYTWGGCYLKTSGAGEITSVDPGAVSGACVAEDATEEPTHTCAIESGFNFVGGDIPGRLSIPVKTVQACAQQCHEHAACKFFTYVWGNCYLKVTAAGRVAQFSAMSGSCAKSTDPSANGNKLPPRKDCTASSPGVDFKFNDIPMSSSYYTRVTGTPDACSTLCGAVDGCSHFTFLDERCYLKNSDAGKYNNAAAVSGSCMGDAELPENLQSAKHNCNAVERLVPNPGGGDAKYTCDQLAQMNGCTGSGSAAAYIRSMCPHTCDLCTAPETTC